MFLRTGEMSHYISTIDEMKQGQQVYVNHEHCPAGEDVKRRLCIHREYDCYLFYCHHCSSKGVYKTPDRAIRDTVDGVTFSKNAMVEQLNCCVGEKDMSKWPDYARFWWCSYGFGQDDADMWGIQWWRDRLWLWSPNCFVGRGFTEGDSKYYKVSTGNDSPLMFPSVGDAKYIVVCEDLLSAYRLVNSGYVAMCLTGTSMKDSWAAEVAGKYGLVVVWLDHDLAGQTAATKILNTLRPLCGKVGNVRYRQPKECSQSIIDREINKCMTSH